MGWHKKTEGSRIFRVSIPIWLWVILVAVIYSGWDVLMEGPLWRWLQEGGTTKESHGTTLRNFTLFLVAVVGLPLAIWRSIVAQRGLQNDRYQKSVDMLGSESLATRMGGIYVLERLAKEDMKGHHIQIMDILCFLLRYPTPISPQQIDAMPTETSHPLPDIQEVFSVIGRRTPRQRKLERTRNWRLNLSKANLKEIGMKDAHLEGADLTGVNLNKATLWCAHLDRATLRNAYLMHALLMDANMKHAVLEGAWLTNTNLKNANLEGANLHQAHLDSADLTNAILKDVKYLTQEMLNRAAYLGPDGKPLLGPNLTGAYCADSGDPLIWGDLSNS